MLNMFDTRPAGGVTLQEALKHVPVTTACVTLPGCSVSDGIWPFANVAAGAPPTLMTIPK